jgi:AraC family transcriptional regulator
VAESGRLFPRPAIVPEADSHALVDALVDELARDRPGRTLAVDGLASALLASGTRAPDRPVRTSEPAHAAAAHMREHLADDLDLTTLAGVAHVSPWHLSRLFRSTFGLPPRQYLLRLRVRAAAQLLETTDLPVAAVAARVGFHNLGHFRSSFRRFLGASPAVWRARRR